VKNQGMGISNFYSPLGGMEGLKLDTIRQDWRREKSLTALALLLLLGG